MNKFQEDQLLISLKCQLSLINGKEAILKRIEHEDNITSISIKGNGYSIYSEILECSRLCLATIMLYGDNGAVSREIRGVCQKREDALVRIEQESILLAKGNILQD